MAEDQPTATQSLTDTASELARRWATQRLAAIQSYSRILADYGSGRASGSDAAQAYAKLAVEEAVRYPTQAYGIASDYATAVARAAGLASGPARAAPAAQAPVIDIELSGAPGRVASRSFVLENPYDAPIEIGFTATNFHDGEQQIAVAPTLTPATATIPAGGEQAVKISVKIDRKKFAAGGIYSANIAVEGFDHMVIRVHLTVAGAT